MNAYKIFSWFMGYNAMLKIGFALITLLVFIYAFHLYKLTSQKQLKLFSFAFLSISLSYIMNFLIGLSIFYMLPTRAVGKFMHTRAFQTAMIFGNFLHMLLFTIGLVLLTYMTFKHKDKKLLFLLLALGILPLLFISKPILLFHLISVAFLIVIVLFYKANYKKHKKTQSFLVLSAFLFLLLSNLLFIFSIQSALSHFIGDMLELVAYLLILANLMLLKRK